MNMLKYRRAHNKLQSHDGPPELTPIDTEIARHQGSSVALEATQERLQACKNFPTPDFPKIIEQRTRENGRLRHELAYQQRKNGASMYLLEELKNTINYLQQAILNFQKLNEDSGEHDTGSSTETPVTYAS